MLDWNSIINTTITSVGGILSGGGNTGAPPVFYPPILPPQPQTPPEDNSMKLSDPLVLFGGVALLALILKK